MEDIDHSKDTVLVHISYGCEVSEGDRKSLGDEWILHSKSSAPKIGRTGLGNQICTGRVSGECSSSADCHPSGGIVDKVEPYTEERAQELGLKGSGYDPCAKCVEKLTGVAGDSCVGCPYDRN